MRTLVVVAVTTIIWVFTAWMDVGAHFIGGTTMSVDYGRFFRTTVWLGAPVLLGCMIADIVNWRSK